MLKEDRKISIQYLTLVTLDNDSDPNTRLHFLQDYPFGWEIADTDYADTTLLVKQLTTAQLKQLRGTGAADYLGTSMILSTETGMSNGLMLMCYTPEDKLRYSLTICPKYGDKQDYEDLLKLYQSPGALTKFLDPQLNPLHKQITEYIKGGMFDLLPDATIIKNVGQLVAF